MEILEREAALKELVTARDEPERGHGSVVLMTGEPGIGKTALVSHFEDGAGIAEALRQVPPELEVIVAGGVLGTFR